MRNPDVVTAEQALKISISRHDVESAAKWAIECMRQDYEVNNHAVIEGARWEKQMSAVSPERSQQFSYSPESVDAFIKSVEKSGTMTRVYYSNYQVSAESIKGQGKFYRDIRRRIYQILKIDKPDSFLARYRPKVSKVVKRSILDYHYPPSRKNYRQRLTVIKDEPFGEISYLRKNALEESKIIANNLFEIYPGIPEERRYKIVVSIAMHKLRSGKSIYEKINNRDIIDILRKCGVKSSIIAGKMYRALGFSTPEEYVKSDFCSDFLLDVDLHVKRWLASNNLDGTDTLIIAEILNIPGVPSERQCFQAVNRVTEIRKQQKVESSVHGVFDWLSTHPGIKRFVFPKGWRWLSSSDAESLCKWAIRNGACILGRIEHGNMDDYAGVAVGPDWEVVGIQISGNYAACYDEHACGDRQNRHDRDAWLYFNKPQRIPSSAAIREERRIRLQHHAERRLAKEIARRTLERQYSANIAKIESMAEKTNKWQLLDNPVKAIRVFVDLPGNSYMVWSSQR